MLTIAELVNIIEPAANSLKPGQKAFSNYLRYLCNQDHSWSEEHLTQALEMLAHFPHWRQNSAELLKDISVLLNYCEKESGLRLYSQALQLEKSEALAAFPEVFEVNSRKNRQELIRTHLKFRLDAHKEYRLLTDPHAEFNPEESPTYYALILNDDQSLSVRQYLSQFVVRNGALEPLFTELSLEFNSRLDLASGQPQCVWIAPYTLAYFQIENTDSLSSNFSPHLSISGHICRGLMLEPVRSFSSQSLETVPSLFFFVKKIENLFLKKDTNPYYVKIVRGLEKTVHSLKHGLSLSLPVSEFLIEAKNALEYVFLNDSLLNLLIKELEMLSSSEPLNRQTPRRPEPQLTAKLNQTLSPTQSPSLSQSKSTSRHLFTGQMDHLDFIEEKVYPSVTATKKSGEKTHEHDLQKSHLRNNPAFRRKRPPEQGLE